MCTCVYLYVRICLHACFYAHTCLHASQHACVRACVCVYMCMYMHTPKCRRWFLFPLPAGVWCPGWGWVLPPHSRQRWEHEQGGKGEVPDHGDRTPALSVSANTSLRIYMCVHSIVCTYVLCCACVCGCSYNAVCLIDFYNCHGNYTCCMCLVGI